MRQRHYPILRGNEVFVFKIFMALMYFGPAIIPVLIPNRGQFVSDDLHQPIWITQNLQILPDPVQHLQIFVADLVLFQTCQPVQSQVEYCLRLGL